MTFPIGSLVKARDREWVVLPESVGDMLVLRPLGGADHDTVGIHQKLEPVQPAQFGLPDPTHIGDHVSCRLLRDAVRLSVRASAGPFRSFARIAVEPRPYQLVPLLMALRLDPVRLLIADDVGIGKTIEAALVARELIDRREAQRLAVLCPPQLAEQWQAELHDKFHIDAELVLPSTATRLEAQTSHVGQSLFDIHPFVIVSTDFIKSDRRRDDFLRACPELVIVDEAHTCAFGGEARGGRHQRHQLLKGLAANPGRHLILVTATPHSGNEGAFRSLLALLTPEFVQLPDDLGGRENEANRRKLALYFVQRKRGDIRRYLDAETPFPERDDQEEAYRLTPEYRRFIEHVIDYARETVSDTTGSAHRRRIQWWSALALLRAIGSSPDAAVATLRNRAASAAAADAAEADAIGRRTVFDLVDDESAEDADVTPGSDFEPEGEGDAAPTSHRRRLQALAREAEALRDAKDAKLQRAVQLVKSLVADGHQPIVFCRFIQTAEYVAATLRETLRGVTVAAVTGTLPPAEREQRVLALGEAERRVLVATDCLSEGINLQGTFDAVLHYDLSWNPTRHEQREGRVDRYGQPKARVRAITLYGQDNPIDGLVLDVLIRKHKTIRNSLGISVPVPVNGDEVIEALMEGLLLRGRRATASPGQIVLAGMEDAIAPKRREFDRAFDESAEREKRSRTMFAQETIKVEDIAYELAAARAAVGSGAQVQAFVTGAARALGGTVSMHKGASAFNLAEAPRALHDGLNGLTQFTARFELPVNEGEVYLSRAHPIVTALANHVMETALDALPIEQGQRVAARRCGAIRTDAVQRRITVLLLRLRHHIANPASPIQSGTPLLAEEAALAAFAGAPDKAEWLSDADAEALLQAEPRANITPDQARDFVQKVIDGFDALRPKLAAIAVQRAEALAEAHQRVRAAARLRHAPLRVEPQLPVDVLGIYVFLPAPA